MNSLYIFGTQLNGLEFITYILTPVSILLFILIYIYFNIELIKISYDIDLDFLNKLDKSYKIKLKMLEKKLNNITK